MNKTRIWIIFLFALFAFYSRAQDTLVRPVQVDTNALKYRLKKTHVDIALRNMFMSTTNEGSLKDDQAWGIGFGLGFHTRSIYGFDLAVFGYAIQRVWSTDLLVPDAQTQVGNRYEVGLFDILNPGKYSNLVRLEKLLLRYKYKQSSIQVGRMKLNTPFLNPQDGRLNVTLEEGAWFQFSELKRLQISGGWIWKISPRSTMRWYDVGSTFGMYSSGINVFGQKSNYTNNIQHCAGLALANVSYSLAPNLKVQVWNMMVDHVMNTAMVEVNHSFGKTIRYYEGLMFIHQDALNDGGNSNQTMAYIPKGSASNAFSAQFGLKVKRLNLSVNYSRISNTGRFLSPREWGREPFYTFMYRERNDGAGDVQAFVVKASQQLGKDKWKIGIALGNFQMPDVRDARLNKYGMPSYQQVNVDLNYKFKKAFRGLEASMILAYKIGTGNTYANLNYVINKVNMLNGAVVVDYKF